MTGLEYTKKHEKQAQDYAERHADMILGYLDSMPGKRRRTLSRFITAARMDGVIDGFDAGYEEGYLDGMYEA